MRQLNEIQMEGLYKLKNDSLKYLALLLIF